jgi:hypothetical protein
MDDVLSPEGNLAAVLNLDPDALLEGTGTDDLSHLFEQGIARRRPATRERLRRETADALRVLRAVARQVASGTANGEVSLTIPERRVLEKLLAQPIVWEAAVTGPIPTVPEVEGAPEGNEDGAWESFGGVAEDPRDDAGHVTVRLKPSPRGRVRSLFEFCLSFAAVTLAEITSSGKGARIGICQAPVEPADLHSPNTCGRFYVGETRGRRKEWCSANCRQRVKRRLKHQYPRQTRASV